MINPHEPMGDLYPNEWRRTVRAWEENGRWYEESTDWYLAPRPVRVSLAELTLLGVLVAIVAIIIVADVLKEYPR